MTTRQYIAFDIISTGPRADQFMFAPSAADAATPLSFVELTPSEAADERRRPGRVIAESMPLSLIEPLRVSASELTGTSWGIEAVGATRSPRTGKGVTVAVLDTGIDASHPAFTGVAIEQCNFTDDEDGDTEGHGTHCAGTILGRDVNGHRIGIASGVERLLVGKVLGRGGGDSLTIAKAVQWAVESGAHVISMSLGVDFTEFSEKLRADGLPGVAATSRALAAYRDTVALFGALGDFVRSQSPFGGSAVIVAAAGNASKRNGVPPFTIDAEPPSVSEGMIASAALGQGTDGALFVAEFSNTGAALAAPGVDIISAAPGGGFQSMDGTSMAAPHVAGVAALWAQRLLEANGELNPRLLANGVIGNCLALAGLSVADVGAGLVQAPPD